jgi:hypothetical protein
MTGRQRKDTLPRTRLRTWFTSLGNGSAANTRTNTVHCPSPGQLRPWPRELVQRPQAPAARAYRPDDDAPAPGRCCAVDRSPLPFPLLRPAEPQTQSQQGAPLQTDVSAAADLPTALWHASALITRAARHLHQSAHPRRPGDYSVDAGTIGGNQKEISPRESLLPAH